MNDLVLTLGLAGWKPLLTALLFPPAPFMLLALVAASLLPARRVLGWLLLLLALAGIWLGTTAAAASLLTRALLDPPPALPEAQIAELKHAPRTAIVVLGGGRRLPAPEFGMATLKTAGLERLRYGLWLSRRTGLPVAFSGGLAPGSEPGATEADIAARIAQQEFDRPLHWTENLSRDTRENAIRTVALLAPQGIERIVLVTHAYHMRRALRNFDRAVAAAGADMRVVAAPAEALGPLELTLLDWLPSAPGFERVRLALHEYLGLLVGA